MEVSSLTCLNPRQGLGAFNIDPREPKNGQKWPKMLQNGSKSSFVGLDGSNRLKLPVKQLNSMGASSMTYFKKVRKGWPPRISPGGPNIFQK